MSIKRAIVLLLLVLFILPAIALFAVRITALADGPLEPWHTYVPAEMDSDGINSASWADYINAENALFADLEQAMAEELNPEQYSAYNRFYEKSRVYPGNLTRDWNRSYVAEPSGSAEGAVVLLHGLTDSPYSLRHVADHFQSKGFVVVSIRMPGHGTVPAGLTTAHWEDWMAATRLAVREAVRRTPEGTPLYLVGFSNGGALAVKYALDALDNPRLTKPSHLVLISPMIGVSRYARFAGIAGLPAIFPAFTKAAWLSLLPEFNPFKYNSFPVNAARQTYELTEAVRQQMLANAMSKEAMPPILTYQSLVDHTVSTRAIKADLYDQLPANGSELLIFDTNRSLPLDSLMLPAVSALRGELSDPAGRNYALTLITTRAPYDARTQAIELPAGQTNANVRLLDTLYPANLYSLSHVALPFPLDDALYGQAPNGEENYGLRLGAINVRGERGTLILDAETFTRTTSNPFFGFMLDHMDNALDLH